jgi:cellobiose-specific phosphotransferase system component IIC
MRKLSIVAALVAASLVAGCTLTTGSASLDAKISAALERIQQKAAGSCGFVPAISTVGQLLQIMGVAGAGAISTAVENFVADKICAAVATPVAARRGAKGAAPLVCHGDKCIEVRGYHVR